MTDARLPEQWLNARKFRRLSDREWRSYTYALMWSNSNRTDGVIEHRDIEDIPGFDPSCVPTFVDGDLWSRIDDGWLIVDFLSTQTTRAELEQRERNRVKERERKARHRAKTANQSNVPRDGDGDGDADSRTDFAGQDRTGQDRLLREGCSEFRESENGEHPSETPVGDEYPTLCWGCGDGRPVGAAGRNMDDGTLCRGCNDDRCEEVARWVEDES